MGSISVRPRVKDAAGVFGRFPEALLELVTSKTHPRRYAPLTDDDFRFHSDEPSFGSGP
jgi:hypothetical protein